jgi:glycosyltransferase involved in cell wall biosynthesis
MNGNSLTNLDQHATEQPDLVCFSHLRWDFVFQRPQHLFTRFAKVFRTFFIEEPKHEPSDSRVELNWVDDNLCIIVPFLNLERREEEVEAHMRNLLSATFDQNGIQDYIFWYYTPMAQAFTSHLQPQMTVYDCMDELSAFKFAPPRLKQLEQQLLQSADVVFTGGVSLYEAKKNQHTNIHPFPSSIDKDHFAQARNMEIEPADQQDIPHPRLGFYGVVDERFDLELIDKVADSRPDWHFIILGPVVKIDPASLPRRDNIHYLGSKSYRELPTYLAGWDIAIIPFARNESTRFISPTKTPEYLAAGKPVISTSIRDVVDPYGKRNLVKIADEPQDFIQAAESILSNNETGHWLQQVDEFLQDNSWDRTWMLMMQHLQEVATKKPNVNIKKKKEAYV